MAETYRKEIVQRITKNLLDIQLLRLVQARKVYAITKNGKEYLQIYYGLLREQLEGKDCT